MPVESIKVPNLGDSKDVEVIELLVKPGQTVSENDSLMVLESDKAAMEIPSPKSGVVKSISIKVGDLVSEGHEILMLEVEGSASVEAPAEKPAARSEATFRQEAAPAAAPVAAPATSGGSSVELIEVPDLGGDSDVEVIEIHVKVGDTVKKEDSLITLESDKAAMDIPAPKAGVVKSLKLKLGDKVSKGSAILELQVNSAEAPAPAAIESKPAAPVAAPAPAAAQSASAQSAVAQKAASPQPAVAATEASSGEVYAGPAVRKLARELGVDLTQVTGTGARNRIQKEDIHSFVKTRLQTPVAAMGMVAGISAVPDIDFSQFGPIEQVPMSKLHKVTAVNMQRNWSTVPHVAQFNEADITDLEAFRNDLKGEADKKGVKLTFLPFLLKACAKTLQEYKQFNVSLHSSGEYIIQKNYIHIGVAVATEAGLMVPVIRDVDKKSLWELAAEVAAMSDKAKQRRLTKEDMQGACFTISSLGALGGTGFIPIVNAPEVAILGVSRTQTKPVYMNGQLVPRQMLPITLSYDHRAVNGVDGGLFATYLCRLLGDIRLLAL
ncbi:MAG: dihydrolipoyllysine-residue acetyltransferase [Gammaproteobacteria bacterium]|nr:dihydrolipoyllysine-residue acetyltransferase [Gammaproteobacteria bacterium]MDP2140154.1 dihydrolipoyllysine-residue acetyltransferase [Gammaproteobacteria bacterium]MDP2347126.1 dihydrolipoyllysine-residue acetyltransferase [Gammaproteobacteria bacterium]